MFSQFVLSNDDQKIQFSDPTSTYYADAYNPNVGHKLSKNQNINNPLSDSVLLSSIDYTNRMPLLHNNIPEIPHRIKLEKFTMIIDSADRDCNLYPNPFEYKVSVGPQIQQKIMEYVRNLNGDVVFDSITKQPLYNEKNIPTSGPVIQEPIFWIKKIRLDSVVLPRSHTLNCNNLLDSANIHESSHPMLNADRSIQVVIPELTRKCRYSTNDDLSNCFAVLSDYHNSNHNFFLAINRCAAVDYSEPLDKLNTLSITFKDSQGCKLQYDYLKNCQCCAKNTCYNSCCSVLDKMNNKYTTYTGACFIDFVKPVVYKIKFDGILDIEHCKFTNALADTNIDYELEHIECNDYKLTLNGSVLGNHIELKASIHQIITGTYDIFFEGVFNKNNIISGHAKFVLNSHNELSAVIDIMYNYEKLFFNFASTIAYNKGLYILNPTKIQVISKSHSIEEYIKISIPHFDQLCNELKHINGVIGNSKAFKITYNGMCNTLMRKLECNLGGWILGNLINVTINFCGVMGTITGECITNNQESQDVSLIIIVDKDSVSITGMIGKQVINYTYALPNTVCSKSKNGVLVSRVKDLHDISFCYNLDDQSIEISNKNIIFNSSLHSNDAIFGKLFCSGDNKYFGSYYNLHTNKREIINMYKRDGVCWYNGDDLIFVKTKNMKIKTDTADCDIIQNLLINNINLTSTPLIGDMNTCLSDTHSIFISQLEYECQTDQSECNYEQQSKKCCDCPISMKDRRLQNQLFFTVELLQDEIPLINNKQN